MDMLLGSSHLLIACFFIFFLSPSISTDILLPTHTLRDGETIVSAGNTFALGFFSPDNSTNRYLGIWYHNIPDDNVVWVANRQNPLRNSSAVLTIIHNNLVILDENRRAIWSVGNNATSARLLDSGNLVVNDSQGRMVWQSFDYPTNTMLPGMKIGIDYRTGLVRFLKSWKLPNDPAQGEFSFGIDPQGVPEFFVWKGINHIWRIGPWNGQGFSGYEQIDRQGSNSLYNRSFVYNEKEAYFTASVHNSSFIIMRLVLDVSGQVQRQMWENLRWNLFWARSTSCDMYGQCGKNSLRKSDKEPPCECLQGFQPRSPKKWSARDWSDGCERRTALKCGEGDGIFKVEHVKLPDT